MVADSPPPEEPAEQEAPAPAGATGGAAGGGGAGEAAVEAVAAGAAATAATAPTHVLNQERFNVFNEGLLFYATYCLLLLLALMVVVGELKLTQRPPTLLFLPPCLLLPLLLCCLIASIPCKSDGQSLFSCLWHNLLLTLWSFPINNSSNPNPQFFTSNSVVHQLTQFSCRKLLLKELKMDTGDGAQVGEYYKTKQFELAGTKRCNESKCCFSVR